MKITERQLGLMGIGPTVTELRFSKAELAVMVRASTIVAEAREKCHRHIGPDWVDGEEDYILASAEHACSDIIDAHGRVEIASR